jgi:hypothetical protein
MSFLDSGSIRESNVEEFQVISLISSTESSAERYNNQSGKILN